MRLTFSHREDDALSAGFPSYVMQEEFSRFVGFWWAPTAEGEDLAGAGDWGGGSATGGGGGWDTTKLKVGHGFSCSEAGHWYCG